MDKDKSNEIREAYEEWEGRDWTDGEREFISTPKLISRYGPVTTAAFYAGYKAGVRKGTKHG